MYKGIGIYAGLTWIIYPDVFDYPASVQNIHNWDLKIWVGDFVADRSHKKFVSENFPNRPIHPELDYECIEISKNQYFFVIAVFLEHQASYTAYFLPFWVLSRTFLCNNIFQKYDASILEILACHTLSLFPLPRIEFFLVLLLLLLLMRLHEWLGYLLVRQVLEVSVLLSNDHNIVNKREENRRRTIFNLI